MEEAVRTGPWSKGRYECLDRIGGRRLAVLLALVFGLGSGMPAVGQQCKPDSYSYERCLTGADKKYENCVSKADNVHARGICDTEQVDDKKECIEIRRYDCVWVRTPAEYMPLMERGLTTYNSFVRAQEACNNRAKHRIEMVERASASNPDANAKGMQCAAADYVLPECLERADGVYVSCMSDDNNAERVCRAKWETDKQQCSRESG